MAVALWREIQSQCDFYRGDGSWGEWEPFTRRARRWPTGRPGTGKMPVLPGGTGVRHICHSHRPSSDVPTLQHGSREWKAASPARPDGLPSQGL